MRKRTRWCHTGTQRRATFVSGDVRHLETCWRGRPGRPWVRLQPRFPEACTLHGPSWGRHQGMPGQYTLARIPSAGGFRCAQFANSVCHLDFAEMPRGNRSAAPLEQPNGADSSDVGVGLLHRRGAHDVGRNAHPCAQTADAKGLSRGRTDRRSRAAAPPRVGRVGPTCVQEGRLSRGSGGPTGSARAEAGRSGQQPARGAGGFE